MSSYKVVNLFGEEVVMFSEREKTLIKGLEPNKTIQKTRTYEMGT